MQRMLGPLLLVVTLAAFVSSGWGCLAAAPIERASISSDGRQGDRDSGVTGVAISGDGRLVAFDAAATNLVQGDRNGKIDAFVHHRDSGETRCLSANALGDPANEGARGVALSGDGRVVAFCSRSTDLVEGAVSDRLQVFVRDTVRDEVTLCSIDQNDIPASQTCSQAALSGDGTVVVYCTAAANLCDGDDNGDDDIYLRDLVAGRTERVSVGPGGVGGNAFSRSPDASHDGRYVVFASAASNLGPSVPVINTHIYRRDRQAGTTMCVSRSSAGALADEVCDYPSISGDGRWVAFESSATNLVPGDTNGTRDVFVHDCETGATTRVSVTSAGGESHASPGRDMLPVISADGSAVVYCSDAPDLVPGDTAGQVDVFVHDLATGETTCLSMGGNGRSGLPAISNDGRVAAFASLSGNLVSGDSNGRMDVFCVARWEAPATPTPTATCTLTPTAAPTVPTAPVARLVLPLIL